MHKIAEGDDLDRPREHRFAPIYRRETMSCGTERIVAGSPGGDLELFRALVHAMTPPWALLYLLHTPRGEGEPGRYASQPLEPEAVDAFLDRFGDFLRGDARHDIWAHSPADGATVVWDRHNLIYAYGLLDAFEAVLKARGFGPGLANAAFAHIHYYRDEFDADATALLSAQDWHWSPLRPGDEQVAG